MVLQLRRPTREAIVGSFSSISLYVLYSLSYKFEDSVPALVIISLSCTFFMFVEPIKQPQAYHNFADKRVFLCSCHASTEGFFLPPGSSSDAERRRRRRRGFVIPHFGDVMSNIVIFAGGLFGIFLLQQSNDNDGVDNVSRKWQLDVCLPILFYSTIAISVGSTYYHWNPHDASLVFDRLPMTLAFVSIFCFMLEEYIPNNSRLGQSLLTPLLLLGIFSVLYWRWMDDLRLYALVQFLPLIIIAGLLVCYQPKHGGAFQHTLALICYALAKICEDLDYTIFARTNKRISGHSMKHVLAGIASILLASVLL